MGAAAFFLRKSPTREGAALHARGRSLAETRPAPDGCAVMPGHDPGIHDSPLAGTRTDGGEGWDALGHDRFKGRGRGLAPREGR